MTSTTITQREKRATPRDGVRIAAAEPADAPAIEALVQRAYTPYVQGIGVRPMPLDADHRSAIARGEVFVAREGGILGAIVLVARRDCMIIENVAVEPARHGEGIGRVLLAFAEAQARAADLPRLRLCTHEAMSRNLRIYSQLGYSRDDRPHPDPASRVFMSKWLR
jgi:GNAT superfamily N-acetyltransferase